MLIAPVLREYRASDFDTLWMIDQACFEPGISYSRRELAFYIDRQRGFTLVAQQRAKIVGFIVVHRNRRNQGHVITVDVLPETRRSGLGSRLLAAAEERLRTLGCGAVFLETAVDNAAAIGLYKRHGYTVVDRIPDYYLDSIDALVLAKNLDPLKSE
jgi:ribosomal-protein-alanine N-acetyltransferase